jgi:hypothetical protein
MSEAQELHRAESEVKSLRKQSQYWRGRVTAELNKRARAEYIKATAPESDEALMLCSVTLQNMRTQAANYREVAESFAAQLRKAEAALEALRADPP